MSEPEATSRLSAAELRRRARGGVFVIGSWGVLNLVVGFAGNLVLARLLLPRDFGLVAIGMTAMLFANALSDGGLGSGLIRREHDPTRSELRAVLALQLALTGTLGGIVAIVASRFGDGGLVVALMMLGLPLASFQTPGRVVLSRALLFRAIATVDALALVGYYAWAVSGVVAGYGVWALASGVVLRAAISSVGLLIGSRLGLLLPGLASVRSLRSVVGFGIRFQGVHFAGLLREQGLNAGIGAFAGVSTLGLWAFSRRLLELPVLFFEPLWRVSFPLMSGLLAAKEDPAPVIQRTVGRSATIAGVILAPLAAAAPGLVPGVFGSQWTEAATVIQLGCAALLVAGPVSVAAIGYLYAVGAPSVVLRATLFHTAALYAVAFSLVPSLGVAAVGLGSLAGAVVDVAVLGRALARRTGARPYRPLVGPLVIALAAASAGALLTERGDSVVAGLAGGAVAATIYVALFALFRRPLLVDTISLAASAVRAGLAPAPPAPTPAAERL